MKTKGPLLNHKLADYIFLVLFAVISYWPVSFMVYSLKGDALNYFLAMRYNLSESIQAGIFPYWSPYINLGYPLHADLQTGVWNPLVLLISLTGKYDIYRLHAETIIVIIIAGIGMHTLLKHFFKSRQLIVAISSAYMLNGLIADGGQFLTWLYSAAILPFVFLFMIRCFKERTIKNAFGLGFSHALMFICSYTADFILLTYVMVSFVALLFIRDGKSKGYLLLFKQFGRQGLVSILVFGIVALPALISFLPFLHYMDRGSGLSLYSALINSMSPACFISFIVPWASMKGEAFSYTDSLLRNCYIGIVPFVYFIVYLFYFKKKPAFQKYLIALFFLFLIFSLGSFAGIRTIAYHFLPLLDTFKHPAKAKLFFIFFGLLISAFALNEYEQNTLFYKKKIAVVTKVLLAILVVGIIVGFLNSNVSNLLVEKTRQLTVGSFIKDLMGQLSFFDLLFFNCCIAQFIASMFFLLLKKNILIKFLVPLICVDMFVSLQVMLPLTYVRNGSPSEITNILRQQPKGYPIPDINTSLAENSENGMIYFPFMGCLNPYNKKPGRAEHVISPSNLSIQDRFWRYKPFREKIMEYPIVYLADTVLQISDTAMFVNNNQYSNQKVAIAEELFDFSPVSDVSHWTKPNSIEFEKMSPNRFEFSVANTNKTLFVLQQNYYFPWKVYVNKQRKDIKVINISFMGVVLNPGKNEIVFEYDYPFLPLAGIISLTFSCIGFIFFFIKKQKKIEPHSN